MISGISLHPQLLQLAAKGYCLFIIGFRVLHIDGSLCESRPEVEYHARRDSIDRFVQQVHAISSRPAEPVGDNAEYEAWNGTSEESHCGYGEEFQVLYGDFVAVACF